MRQARADKRQARATDGTAEEIGRAVLSGPVFGGVHVVRVLAVNDGRPVVDFEVDGVMRGIRTERGARAALTRTIVGGCNPGSHLHQEQKRSDR